MLFVGALLLFQNGFGHESRPLKDYRLAYLMGMTAFTGHPPNLDVFPSKSDPSSALFERIARLYAEDMGLSAKVLERDAEWRAAVASRIADCYGGGASHVTMEDLFGGTAHHDPNVGFAYLAGAHARFGQPTGFKLINFRKGLYLMRLVRENFFSLGIEATVPAGGPIPGNITITLRNGGEQSIEGFLKSVEAMRKKVEMRQ